jgi:hypothetical protein
MNTNHKPRKITVGHGGFALVATLTLMVLLALLALGLLSLSSITLRQSSQGSAKAEAQSNARMALMLAIGQLQRELGPDSRISAPHDAGSPANGKPHWTAVYDAWTATDPAGNQPHTPESRIVKFREWLVSGGAGATQQGEVTLVGPGTLGKGAAQEDQVSVPFHSLNGTGGRVAWWISDEGMKARINAGPDDSAPTPGISNPLFHAQSPPHADHRVFAALANFEWKDGQRELSLSPAQVNLAAGLGNGGLGSAFHDLTVHSAGVLSDVTTGRLKRDLSQLLTRPLAELRNKPLYVANGQMNRFNITPDGDVSNLSFVQPWKNTLSTGGRWGINLEELALFHNIHRELVWDAGGPTLVTKESADRLAEDPYYLYGRHVIDAMQFILSLQARRTGGTNEEPLYKLDIMLDGMVALTNPNDVRLRYSPGLQKHVRLLNFPYDMRVKIEKAAGGNLTAISKAVNLQVFQGYIEGGFGNFPVEGFDLEPGEAAAFGDTQAQNSGFNLNIRRGFVPSGGVRMTGWDLKANNLSRNDKVDFEMIKTTTAINNSNSNVYYQAWHGGTRIFDSSVLTKDFGEPDGELMNRLLPPKILPPQIRPVSDFIDRPQPIMLLNIIRNVERNSNAEHPDALPSRPGMLYEPANGITTIWRNQIPMDFHKAQSLYTAEPLNYQFRSFAAGQGGRNIYHGGGRQPAVGGQFRVIKRRIPLAPPLSLGAFENAIAAGFCARFGDVDSAWGAIGSGVNKNNVALAGSIGGGVGFPAIAKAIGNSFSHPFLPPYEVHNGSTTDPSWMVNTALWDSWFLSGIVDGSGTNPDSPMKDTRSARAQFRELAEGTGSLRNKRYLFHSHKATDQALDELFTGEAFKRSALSRLGKHLMIDGAFNVNSTSAEAWSALLRSVAGQELLLAGGGRKKFGNPYGTIGYAANETTTGTEGDWSGLRDLTDTQITDLAEAIVEEVRQRGPFLSLADFVNRRPNAGESEHQVVGALQAAIDKSGVNDRFTGAARQLTGADLDPLPGGVSIDAEPAPARAVGSAGHLRQANILTALGSQISVRSDTFVVRAYGDSRDKSGNIRATAYCEAVVQRVPEFVDPVDPPEASPSSTLNLLFGRSFRTVSFRWLSPSEI